MILKKIVVFNVCKISIYSQDIVALQTIILIPSINSVFIIHPIVLYFYLNMLIVIDVILDFTWVKDSVVDLVQDGLRLSNNVFNFLLMFFTVVNKDQMSLIVQNVVTMF